MVECNKQPVRHPLKRRRNVDGSRFLKEQQHLPWRRLNTILSAIFHVARKIAQAINAKNVVHFGAWIHPKGEDEVFGGGLVAPEAMASKAQV